MCAELTHRKFCLFAPVFVPLSVTRHATGCLIMGDWRKALDLLALIPELEGMIIDYAMEGAR